MCPQLPATARDALTLAAALEARAGALDGRTVRTPLTRLTLALPRLAGCRVTLTGTWHDLDGSRRTVRLSAAWHGEEPRFEWLTASQRPQETALMEQLRAAPPTLVVEALLALEAASSARYVAMLAHQEKVWATGWARFRVGAPVSAVETARPGATGPLREALAQLDGFDQARVTGMTMPHLPVNPTGGSRGDAARGRPLR